MKNIVCYTVMMLFSALQTMAQQTSILFIGNSYIYTADLPGTLRNLALAGGDSVYHESSTPGGYTFEQHSTNATTLGKIASRDWDHVVLQQQSQMPSFPPSQVAWQTYPFAQILVDSIRSNHSCSEPVFFMTWGRRDGDQNNCAGYPPVCTFEGMNARLRSSYLEMGADNNATVAPCGAAWGQMSVDNNTFWNGLYSGDGSHPSAWGTYLNACVFYATIFRKSPVGIPFYSTIGQPDAEVLQQLAEDIVLDSLSNWYIGHGDVVSNASYESVSDLTVAFNGDSENATAHEWQFGDGTTSDLQTTQHTYSQPGNYSVIHIASSNCGSDTSFIELSLSPSSVLENPLNTVRVETVNGSIHIHNVLNSPIRLNIYDHAGREVVATVVQPSSTKRINIGLTGIYLLRLSDGAAHIARKIYLE